MITLQEKKYWIAFSNIESIGPQKFKLLTAHFPSLKIAWEADSRELKQAGLNEKDARLIIEKRQSINPDEIWEKILKFNINVIVTTDKEYPKPLKEIYSPPAVLYVKGQLPPALDFAIAVVGTRKTSAYGRQITPAIVKDLARTGIVIVSGLALGIDALAHQATLEAGGTTIAVLGCGLETIYPATNRELADKIVKNGGCLLSEYPPGTQPLKQHFPARNRIISGLSRGVLVIEGNEDSGSLITARCALEQNREVLAVPGNITSQTARGPNQLIKMGAKPVTSAADVLEALDLTLAEKFIANEKILPDSQEEEILLKFLSAEPIHIDELIQKSKLNTSIINSTLTLMEMKGKIRHLGGMYYVLSR